MNYWIHRIGRGKENSYSIYFDALWDLLRKNNCLTIGWHCFINDSNVIDSIENADKNQLKVDIKNDSNAIQCLGNFSEMTKGDIIIVLPILECEPDGFYFIVEIQSLRARNILKVPQAMQSTFTTNIFDGSEIVFDPQVGFKRKSNNEIIDAGFFHEVKILKLLKRTSMPQAIKITCDNVLNTNSQVKNNSICQQIKNLISNHP